MITMGADDFSPLRQILSRLQRVESTGTDHTARCPTHKDDNPSLHITKGEDGRVLLHCFAGCETKKIVKALGLKMKDLFPQKPRSKPADREGEADPPDSAETLKPGT